MEDFFFGAGPIIWVQQTLGPGWPFPFRLVSLLGVSWGVIFAAGLGFWLWGRTTAYSILGIIAIEAAVSMLLNVIFSVPRPSHPDIVAYEQISVDSFPSGHLLTTMVMWGWLYDRRKVPFWIAAAVIGAMALARVYLGVHYVGDIVGALVIGLAILYLYRWAYPRAAGWLERRSGSFHLALAGIFIAAAIVAPFVRDNQYIWTAAGVMFAGPIAIALERRKSRERAGRWASPSVTARVILLGTAGLVPFVLLHTQTPESAVVLGGLATALATLWAWWVMPAALLSPIVPGPSTARLESSGSASPGA